MDELDEARILAQGSDQRVGQQQREPRLEDAPRSREPLERFIRVTELR